MFSRFFRVFRPVFVYVAHAYTVEFQDYYSHCDIIRLFRPEFAFCAVIDPHFKPRHNLSRILCFA